MTKQIEGPAPAPAASTPDHREKLQRSGLFILRSLARARGGRLRWGQLRQRQKVYGSGAYRLLEAVDLIRVEEKRPYPKAPPQLDLVITPKGRELLKRSEARRARVDSLSPGGGRR